MARRNTIKDVAREAGVSVATVNRVIAGHSNVRPETAARVAEAAQNVNYHGANLIKLNMPANLPTVRMGFVLNKKQQEFYRVFDQNIQQACARSTKAICQPVIEYCHSQAPADVAEVVRNLANRVDVMAATMVNHPTITQAVTELKAKGVEAFAMLNDFAQGERICYIGMNNLKIGRGAAHMLAKSAKRPGKIAVFVGGHRWHGHDLREAGLRGYFREIDKDFRVLDTLVNLETRQVTYEATIDLLDRHPDLVGLYVAGGGMEGAIEALREERAPGDVALVVNEWTEQTQAALAEGILSMVVATPLPALCERLVALMADAVIGTEAVPGQVFMPPTIHMPEFD